MSNDMKCVRLFPILILLPFLPLYVHAQPTITSANFAVTGDTIYNTEFDTTGLTPGAAGSNITWDFSAVNTNGKEDTMYYLDPTATPYGGIFPSSNYSATDNGSHYSNYTYYNFQNNVMWLVGGEGLDATTLYSDDQQLYALPAAYQDMLSDTFISVINYTNNIHVHRHGTSLTEADGYGTIILPTGTFANVLRIKIWWYETDSLFFGSSFISMAFTTVETYTWFDPDYTNPLYYIRIINIVGAPNPSPKVAAFWKNPSLPIGIPVNDLHTASGWKLYPNPVSIGNGSAMLNLSGTGTSGVLNFELFDLCGRRVEKTEILPVESTSGGSVRRELQIRNIPPGLYLYRIGGETGKLLIQ